MHRFLLSLIFIFSITVCAAQNYKGQWKGSFVDKSVSPGSWIGDHCDYVIDLDVSGTSVSGYSYTYFYDGGKRYYTICKLKGFCDKIKKYVEIQETERTKTNVPVQISNSFQIHKLTWRKEEDKEILEGSWIPAPDQNVPNTGYGTTILFKRLLTKIVPAAKSALPKKNPPVKSFVNARTAPKTSPAAKVVLPKKGPVAKSFTVAKTAPKLRASAVAAKKPVKIIVQSPAKAPLKDPVILVKKDSVLKDIPVATVKAPAEIMKFLPAFATRSNALLQTVKVENTSVKIELYDNGEIDGDSVSLIYNGKLLLTNRKLSDKPICLDIAVDDGSENELIMYADNLGTIPPNTALMVVRDGTKRYEVRITSDLRKSGTIRFEHKK